MLLSTAIVLIPDWSVVVQSAIFLAALTVISRCALVPLLRVRDLRRAATVEAEAEAKQLQARATERLVEYERCIAAARQEGASVKEQLRQEGYAQANKILASSRTVAFASLDTAKQRIAKEAEVARTLLKASVEEFARAITERILERSLNEPPQRSKVVHEEGRR